MRFIRPSVTDNPQASTNRSIPWAMPSTRIVSMDPVRPRRCVPARGKEGARAAPLHAAPELACLLLLRLYRVLDVREGGELDVVQLAADLLDLADVFVVDDVARLRIDRNRSTRALPFGSFHCRNQRVAVGLAAGLLK